MVSVFQVKNGEEMSLVREPDNKLDRNAVQVFNKENVLVGYIERDLGEDLAFIMDRNLANIVP